MKAIIYPSVSCGSVTIPPSKSLLHRYIIASCLAKGKSVIHNVKMGIDNYATINAFLPLGVKYEIINNDLIIDSSDLKKIDYLEVDVAESGSSLRFLLPVLINYAKTICFKGSKSLFSRPLDEYIKIFGKDLELFDDHLIIKSSLHHNNYYVEANVSSQYVTGLIFGLSILDHPSIIILQGKISSRNYIEQTIYVLKQFGINIKWDEEVIYILPSNYKQVSLSVEGDYTLAANYIVLSKINHLITINGLYKESIQNEKIIYDLLEKDEIDLDNIIDLGPILMCYAACIDKKTKFTSTNRLIYKESNRLYALKEEFAKFNVNLEIYDDLCFVNGRSDLLATCELSSHNDHRICMGLSIIATIFKNKVIINEIESVNKSYPDFFNDLGDLGIKIEFIK